MPVTTSGERATMPMSVPTHSIVTASSARIAKAARASEGLPWIRQPTIRPLMTITVMASTEAANSAARWPSRKAERCIGSERKRSRMPSPRSVAIEVAGPMIPNVSVCTRMPPIR